MALTRKFLKALEIEFYMADQMIEAHTETLDGLKSSLEAVVADAGKLPEIQRQLEAAQADLETARKDSYKEKYEALQEDFKAYKQNQAQKETRAAKESAYRALLKSAGISERRMDSVLKVSDVDSVELDANGEIVDGKNRLKTIKEEWADFIETTEITGVDTPNPHVNTGGGRMTKEEIMNIADTEKRQRVMAEHHELFGI